MQRRCKTTPPIQLRWRQVAAGHFIGVQREDSSLPAALAGATRPRPRRGGARRLPGPLPPPPVTQRLRRLRRQPQRLRRLRRRLDGLTRTKEPQEDEAAAAAN